MSDPATPAGTLGGGAEGERGGPQIIPRPAGWMAGPDPYWLEPGFPPIQAITVQDVREALERRGEPAQLVPSFSQVFREPDVPRRPAAVLCALFQEDGQCHVLLTRRSPALRSHTRQVAFPGGRIDEGETPLEAALREAWEEVRLDTSRIEIIGQLSPMHTAVSPAPVVPFVGILSGRPEVVPNPDEVERVFTVPMVELLQPGVYHEEIWPFPGGVGNRAVHFFDLVGDTVWGATARMLTELVELTVPPLEDDDAAAAVERAG